MNKNRMITGLIKYIEDAKRQGFALDEIRHHLGSHGWNDYLIDYAVRRCEAKSDRKWLQGSMMAVLVILLASAGTVWWVNSSSPGASCILESRQGGLLLLSSPQACCMRIQPFSCASSTQHPDVRDGSGQVVMKPDMTCLTAEGRLFIPKKGLSDCPAVLGKGLQN